MNTSKMVSDIIGIACWSFGYTDREVARFEKALLQYFEEQTPKKSVAQYLVCKKHNEQDCELCSVMEL